VYAAAQLVEVLRYKPEGRGFDSDCVTGIFHCNNPSFRTMTLGLTQPRTEMNDRNISLGVKAAGAWGWQPYHLHVPTVLREQEASTSWIPQGLSRLVMGLLYIYNNKTPA